MKNKINAYQSDARQDEAILFESIMKTLQNRAGVEIGRKQTGPSEDYYKCTIDGLEFTLFYDIDYGVSIYAEDSITREKIITCFNN